jgi:gamma-glutamyltranspeptidase/glutathione hydrolase
MKSAGMECLRRLRSGVFLFSVCLTITACSGRQEPPAAAIASAHPLATRAGIDILAAGGNAFDAAVAVSAALAVVEPYSSGLGGGGFWLLHRGDDGFEVVVDGRERAPLAATRDMFLDDDGDVVPDLSLTGALAAGIPGEVAALVYRRGLWTPATQPHPGAGDSPGPRGIRGGRALPSPGRISAGGDAGG